MTSTTITGFEGITLNYKINGKGRPWQGLAKSTSAKAFFDDAPNHTYWWTAVGAMTRGGEFGGEFPAFKEMGLQRKLDLFVKSGASTLP